MTRKQDGNTRERPRLFRALGEADPPPAIDINYKAYHRVKIIKHDSWAATALYESAGSNPGQRVVCKFNRIQPIGMLPMRWLGRALASRESQMYQRLETVPNISQGYDEVYCGGELLAHACAHDYIEGHPLRWHDQVDEQFFAKLESTLAELHRRQIAYVDMNKSENVIVDTAGNPCLIDFQISVHWKRIWLRWLLRILQRSDRYHCAKLKRRFRPDQVEESEFGQKPAWIRAHRKIATPFRFLRRRLLVTLGIRKGKGKPQTEAFIEEALQATGPSLSAVTEPKPILKLYGMLRSPRYVERFATPEEYVDQMMADLFSGGKRYQCDEQMRRRLLAVHDHDKVVDLLRSKTLFELSRNWDAKWISDKIMQIETGFAIEERRRAA